MELYIGDAVGEGREIGRQAWSFGKPVVSSRYQTKDKVQMRHAYAMTIFLWNKKRIDGYEPDGQSSPSVAYRLPCSLFRCSNGTWRSWNALGMDVAQNQ